jgi:hypothetical protein
MPAILAPGSLRQEDHKLEVSLGYTARPSLKKKSCSFLQSYPTLKIIKHISTKTDTSYSKYDD